MSETYIQAIQTADIASGGMKAVELNGRELIICNCDGSFYALDRRCGHMSAPLEMGTLDGTILTCAMHCAQFDVTTGKALSNAVPNYPASASPNSFDLLMQHIRTESVASYPTRVESGWVMIAPSFERE